MPKAAAQAVVLEILRKAEGEWTGKTKLYKAFYFAHLYYGAERPGLLTDWPIARMPQGPGIDRGDELLAELVRDGLMTIETVHEGPFSQPRYRLTDRGWQASPLPTNAQYAIQRAVDYCKDKTATQLSGITHENSRSWIAGKDGTVLNIDIDLIPEDEYLKRQAEFRRLEQSLAGIFDEASS